MQIRIFFINESAARYDRSASFEVFGDIIAANRNFFAAGQPSSHRGFRTARIAQAPDGKLTIEDIEAWDDLVTGHVLPDIDAEIEQLEIQCHGFEGPEAEAAQQAIDMCRSRKALIERIHMEFMDSYRRQMAHMPTFMNPST